MLKTKTVSAEATLAGIKVGLEGAKAPAEPQLYDLVLVAVGRSANGRAIAADKAGVIVTDRGFVPVDKQMAAARALANVSPARLDSNANLLPPVTELRDVSLRLAQAVAIQARKEGLTEPMDAGDIFQKIQNKMWSPVYRPYRRRVPA